jgi:hypothetical protein
MRVEQEARGPASEGNGAGSRTEDEKLRDAKKLKRLAERFASLGWSLEDSGRVNGEVEVLGPHGLLVWRCRGLWAAQAIIVALECDRAVRSSKGSPR